MSLPGRSSPLTLVFSDEFNAVWEANRSWSPTKTIPGDGGRKWSATYQLNSDAYGQTFLHPQMVSASNGTLHLTGRHDRFGGADYLGSQLSSWNRFCYQGGYLEVCARTITMIAVVLLTLSPSPPSSFLLPPLPPSSSSSPFPFLRLQVSFRLPPSAKAYPRGVWTAIWVMGNLARDVYPASAENIWPFTYDECQCPGPVSKHTPPLSHRRAARGMRTWRLTNSRSASHNARYRMPSTDSRSASRDVTATRVVTA